MARDATASRVVEAARRVGVLVPSRSVRDSGATLHPFQQRRSHEPDSSDPGVPRVWARGSSGWMPGRLIRRGDDRRGREDTQYRCHNIAKFCCMARRTGGQERALCGKPIEAIQALAQRKRENGDTARVRFRVGTRRENGVIRHPSGIPTLSARSADEISVLVQVRQAFLQVHRPSVRIGPDHDVVYSTNGTHGQKFKATVSSFRVLGRLPDMPRQGREGSQYEGLPEGETGDRQAALIIRLDTASDEEGSGREYSGGTPWLRYRLGPHAFLHRAAKNRQGIWYRARYPAAGSAREAVGFKGQVSIVLWCVRLIVTGNALCSLLHQDSVRRHDQKAQEKPSIKE
jgi:hypothetical protein